jgi:hypothetical protein
MDGSIDPFEIKPICDYLSDARDVRLVKKNLSFDVRELELVGVYTEIGDQVARGFTNWIVGRGGRLISSSIEFMKDNLVLDPEEPCTFWGSIPSITSLRLVC